MAHYAKLNNGIVVQIIVAEETFFDTFVDTSPGEWLAGKDSQIHRPAIGYTYDDALDAFIPPQPYPSWTLNEDTCQWEPPVSNANPVSSCPNTYVLMPAIVLPTSPTQRIPAPLPIDHAAIP